MDKLIPILAIIAGCALLLFLIYFISKLQMIAWIKTFKQMTKGEVDGNKKNE